MSQPAAENPNYQRMYIDAENLGRSWGRFAQHVMSTLLEVPPYVIDMSEFDSEAQSSADRDLGRTYVERCQAIPAPFSINDANGLLYFALRELDYPVSLTTRSKKVLWSDTETEFKSEHTFDVVLHDWPTRLIAQRLTRIVTPRYATLCLLNDHSTAELLALPEHPTPESKLIEDEDLLGPALLSAVLETVTACRNRLARSRDEAYSLELEQQIDDVYGAYDDLTRAYRPLGPEEWLGLMLGHIRTAL